MSQAPAFTTPNPWIKEELRVNLKLAEEKEREDEPYDEYLKKIDHFLHLVNPSQKETPEYSTQNSDEEKVNFLSKLATTYELIGDYEEASRFYEALDDTVPGHAKTLKGWADCLRKRGENSEAVPKYEEALDNYFYDEKVDASILNCRGISHIELYYSALDSKNKCEEVSLAREDLEKAVEKDSENVIYLCNFGKTLDLQKKTGEALEVYQKAEDLLLVGRIDERLEAEDRQYLEAVLPLWIEFKTTVKASECIFSLKNESVQDPNEESLKSQEVNKLLDLENFKIELREEMFKYAKDDKETNVSLFQNIVNQIIAKRTDILKQKENELVEKLKGSGIAREDLNVIRSVYLKKELRTGLNIWRKKIYNEVGDEGQRKKLIQYFEDFSRTFVSIYTASLVIKNAQIKAYSSLITELSIPALISNLSWIPEDQVLNNLSSIADFLKCDTIEVLSSRLQSFGNEAQFSQRIGEAAYNIIKDPAYQKKIIKMKTEDLKQFSENLRTKTAALEDKFSNQLSDKLSHTPAAMLGNRDASLIASTCLPSTEISEEAVLEDLKRALGNQSTYLIFNQTEIKKLSPSSEGTLKDQIYTLLKEAELCREEPNKHNPIFEKIKQKLPFGQKEKQSVKHEINTTDQKVNYLSKRIDILYDGLGDYEEARKCYEELEQLLPDHSKVLKGLADCYRKLGQQDIAIEKYKEALDQVDKDDDPSLYANISNNLALSFIELGEFDEAIKILEEAVKSDSEHPLYPLTLGKVLSEQNRIDEAIVYFDMANKRFEQSPSKIHPANQSYFEATLPTVKKLIELKKKFASEEPDSTKKKANEVKSKATDKAIKDAVTFDVVLKVRDKVMTKPGAISEAEVIRIIKLVVEEERNRLNFEVKRLEDPHYIPVGVC